VSHRASRLAQISVDFCSPVEEGFCEREMISALESAGSLALSEQRVEIYHCPPSMRKFFPVTQRASSEAR